ncbi:TetR/AcrR family transcriptional regulator [Candidatus Binatia bacterium]|nr:TetR/AcrR family transcriptional regulator [Candidatus Binatia bacterium]
MPSGKMRAAERGTGSRDDAKRETREALVRAGLEEFAARGLDVPSLDAICARAGYTRGAFYVHFKDRDDLIVAAMESVIGTFLDAVVMSNRGADDLEETVTRFLGAVVDGNALTGGSGSMRTHRLLDVCTRSPQVRARFLELLHGAHERLVRTASAGQAAGTVRRDIPAEAVAGMLGTLAMGVVQLYELGAPVDVPALRAAVLKVLVTPAAAPAARPGKDALAGEVRRRSPRVIRPRARAGTRQGGP